MGMDIGPGICWTSFLWRQKGDQLVLCITEWMIAQRCAWCRIRESNPAVPKTMALQATSEHQLDIYGMAGLGGLEPQRQTVLETAEHILCADLWVCH